jgi:hypothetical protein
VRGAVVPLRRGHDYQNTHRAGSPQRWNGFDEQSTYGTEPRQPSLRQAGRIDLSVLRTYRVVQLVYVLAHQRFGIVRIASHNGVRNH